MREKLKIIRGGTYDMVEYYFDAWRDKHPDATVRGLKMDRVSGENVLYVLYTEAER